MAGRGGRGTVGGMGLVRSLAGAVGDLLAPPRCLACRRPAPLPWCAACAAVAGRLQRISPCPRCAGPSSSDHGCWPPDFAVVATVATYRYEEVVATGIGAAKSQAAHAAWPAFGRLLARSVREAGWPAPDVVTWVPADRLRIRRRGFDHARLLAAPVAAALGRPLRALLRTEPGRPDQAGREPALRWRLPAGTFVPCARLDGARVVLVDDVLTTGATLRSAAAGLARAGGGAVRVAVLARAGNHELAR